MVKKNVQLDMILKKIVFLVTLNTLKLILLLKVSKSSVLNCFNHLFLVLHFPLVLNINNNNHDFRDEFLS